LPEISQSISSANPLGHAPKKAHSGNKGPDSSRGYCRP
jgi:hypothetical protein